MDFVSVARIRMPKRREPPDDEINALAIELGHLWSDGEALRPWLRKHREMIYDLVHGDWSWAAMAKVFSEAGIKYSAGKGQDWHAEGLRREFVRAAKALKRDKNPKNMIDWREKTRTNAQSGETLPATLNTIASPPIASSHTRAWLNAADAQARPAAPIFKAFSLKAQQSPPELPPVESEEGDAIRKRMFGK